MGSGGSKKSADKVAEKADKPAEAAPAAAAPAAAPAATPAEAAAPAAAAAPEGPIDDAVYQVVDPPEDFVVEGLKLAGGAVSDHPDVQEGKVLQVAKHPQEHMMQYWLKVEYGSGQIAFVHTLMSCGWNSDNVIRAVGDAQFPPDPKNLPASAEVAPAAAPAAPEEGPVDDAVYNIVDPPEDCGARFGIMWRNCCGQRGCETRQSLAGGQASPGAQNALLAEGGVWLIPSSSCPHVDELRMDLGQALVGCG